MVKSLLTRFVSIEGTDGSDGASHHRNLGLSEPVDALLHVPDNANGRVPRSQGSSRVVGMVTATAPQTGEKAVVRRVCVLIFVDDEGSVLTAKFAQDGVPSSEVFLQCWTIVEQGQRSGNMSVAPRLIPQSVQSIDHRRWIAMAADVGASGQQQVRSKALHVIKIVHVVQRFTPGQNLVAGRVDDVKVAEHLGLEEAET